MINKLVYIIVVLLCLPAFCQQRQNLQGRVVAGNAVVASVFVINKATGTEAKTDGSGNFSLPARTGDVLVVYGGRTELREFAVNQESFKEVPYVMEVKPKAYELEEVVINEQVTPEGLGIVPKGQKQYTPAQRRLYTATNMLPAFSVGTMAGISIPTDFIINAISGRTKMLKKALKTENKEFTIDKINGLYTEQEIRDDLKVPADYVQGFLFYAVEDADCARALKAKNDDLAKLLLMDLAKKYIALIEE